MHNNSEKTVTNNELAEMIVKLDQKISGIDQEVKKLEHSFDKRFTSLDQKIDNVEKQLTLKIEVEIENLARITKNQFDRQGEKLEDIDRKFQSIDQCIDSRIRKLGII